MLRAVQTVGISMEVTAQSWREPKICVGLVVAVVAVMMECVGWRPIASTHDRCLVGIRLPARVPTKQSAELSL